MVFFTGAEPERKNDVERLIYCFYCCRRMEWTVIHGKNIGKLLATFNNIPNFFFFSIKPESTQLTDQKLTHKKNDILRTQRLDF